MKNVYILDESISSSRNGIGTFLRQLLACMKPVANVCVVAFNDSVEDFAIGTWQGVKRMSFPVFPSGNFMNHADVLYFFFKMYVEDSRENVFFVNHSPCSGLLEALKRALPLSKIVFTIHDFGWTGPLRGDVERYERILQARKRESIRKKYPEVLARYEEERKIYGMADAVVCLSEDSRDLLQRAYGLDAGKICWIPNGLVEWGMPKEPKGQLRKSLFIKDDEKVVLFVGRPTVEKGVDVLLQAFVQVLSREPDARLVVAGNASGEWLRQASGCIGSCAARVTFTGQLSRAELCRWYSVADVGVIPSYYEQCSYTGIEMMRAGLPVVASDAFGVRCMFREENAWIASIDCHGQGSAYVGNLRDAIWEVLGSESLRARLSAASWVAYKEKYAIRLMRKRYRDLLARL